MAAVVKWLMGDLVESRTRQVGLRLAAFQEIGKWKSVCPVEVASYFEWHICRGLVQQREWLDDPSPERSRTHIKEIDRFIHNYNNNIKPPLTPCSACISIQTLLTQDQKSIS